MEGLADFAWQFAYNLKTPVTVIAVLVGLFGAIIIHDSRKYLLSKSGYDEPAVLEWRIWTSVNVMILTAIVWLLVQAVPIPTFKREVVTQYQTRTVVQKVPVVKYAKERVVYKVPTYEQAYKLCVDEYAGDGAEICHKQATEASLPLPRVLTRTFYRRDPYETAFKWCVEQRGSYASINDVAATCQAYALRKQIPPSK